ncbi:MAG: hypothetical protein OIF35_05800, partial [Cellvibrionaceae bacterium]|nr:hypothetical protein [Cellvibrionaceae bacterium]
SSFSFCPTGRKYFVDGFAATAFSLMATAGFFPVRLVTSLFKAETTSGSLFTHEVDRWRSGSRFSAAYWCPNRLGEFQFDLVE